MEIRSCEMVFERTRFSNRHTYATVEEAMLISVRGKAKMGTSHVYLALLGSLSNRIFSSDNNGNALVCVRPGTHVDRSVDCHRHSGYLYTLSLQELFIHDAASRLSNNAEKERLDQVRRSLDRLDTALLRLDETLMLFDTF